MFLRKPPAEGRRTVAHFLPKLASRFLSCLHLFAFFENSKFEKTIHMTKSVATIVAWVESQPTTLLVMIVYSCSIAITLMCEIASITILATISTNNIQDESESWMAVWFFAVNGGIAWIVARQCLDPLRGDTTQSIS